MSPTAEITTHQPDPIAAQPPPDPPSESTEPRRGPGRPPTRHKGEESSQEEQLGFWQTVSEVSDAEWERTVMYLYRWLPFYDMTKGGIEPKYVCLYTSAITIDEIKRQHGSGRYNLKINRRDQNQKSDKTIKQIVFDILDPEFPPNLPPGDWQNDARNKKWVWSKETQGAPSAGAHQAAGSGFSAKDIRDFIEMGNKRGGTGLEAEVVKILPALLEQRNAPQQNSMDDLVKLATVIKAIMPTPAAPPAPDNTMINFLQKQIEGMEARMLQTQKDFMELLKQKSEPAKQPDMIESMDKIVGLVSKVADARDALGVGGAASRMNGWQEVASNVGTELIKAVGPALPFMLRPQPVRTAPAAARPLAPGTQPNSSVTQPNQQQPAPPAAAPPAPPSEEETETMDAAMILATQMMNLGIAGPLLTYFNDGESGLRFAMWIADGHGAMPLNLIKGQGKEVVLRAITDHMPDLYAQLRPNWAKFDSFVDSFLTWTPDAVLPEEEDEDEEEDEITVTAAAPAIQPLTADTADYNDDRAHQQPVAPKKKAAGKAAAKKGKSK